MKGIVKKLSDLKGHNEMVSSFSEGYWERQAVDTPLPERKARCHDCAITTDFYTPIADELAKESPDLQRKVCNGWFCHNTPNKMCKGVSEYLGIDYTEKAPDQ